MSTSTIINNTSSQPLERKKTPAPVLDTPENSIEEKRVGWFDQDEFRGFDATTGSINFDSDKIVQPPIVSVVSEMFGGNDKWISIKPSNIAEKVVNTASTAINVTKDLASTSIDAGSDLLNQITGKTEVPQNEDPSKIDPMAAKKQEEEKEYSVIREAEKVIAKAQADYRGEKLFEEAVHSKSSEIAKLANLQGNYRDVLDAKGDVRKDLENPVAQARKRILAAQQSEQNPLASTSKKGGQGNLEANKANETSGGNTNAQNAVG